MNKKFSISARLKSFKFAFAGIKEVMFYQHNARVHLLVAVFAVLMGWLLHISSIEWCFIVLAIGLVLFAEAVNTAIEHFVDLVSPEHQALAGKIKDIAAGAVLICAITALVIGLIIFLPKLG